MDYSTVAGVGSAAAAGVFAVLGWMLKRSVAQMDQKLKEHDEAIQKRADELAAYKLHVAEHFVTQPELTKAIASLEKMIERLITTVSEDSKATRDAFAELNRLMATKADK